MARRYEETPADASSKTVCRSKSSSTASSRKPKPTSGQDRHLQIRPQAAGNQARRHDRPLQTDARTPHQENRSQGRPGALERNTNDCSGVAMPHSLPAPVLATLLQLRRADRVKPGCASGLSFTTLGTFLGISRRTLYRHLEALEAAGLVEKRRRGRGKFGRIFFSPNECPCSVCHPGQDWTPLNPHIDRREEKSNPCREDSRHGTFRGWSQEILRNWDPTQGTFPRREAKARAERALLQSLRDEVAKEFPAPMIAPPVSDSEYTPAQPWAENLPDKPWRRADNARSPRRKPRTRCLEMPGDRVHEIPDAPKALHGKRVKVPGLKGKRWVYEIVSRFRQDKELPAKTMDFLLNTCSEAKAGTVEAWYWKIYVFFEAERLKDVYLTRRESKTGRPGTKAKWLDRGKSWDHFLHAAEWMAIDGIDHAYALRCAEHVFYKHTSYPTPGQIQSDYLRQMAESWIPPENRQEKSQAVIDAKLLSQHDIEMALHEEFERTELGDVPPELWAALKANDAKRRNPNRKFARRGNAQTRKDVLANAARRKAFYGK